MCRGSRPGPAGPPPLLPPPPPSPQQRRKSLRLQQPLPSSSRLRLALGRSSWGCGAAVSAAEPIRSESITRLTLDRRTPLPGRPLQCRLGTAVPLPRPPTASTQQVSHGPNGPSAAPLRVPPPVDEGASRRNECMHSHADQRVSPCASSRAAWGGRQRRNQVLLPPAAARRQQRKGPALAGRGGAGAQRGPLRRLGGRTALTALRVSRSDLCIYLEPACGTEPARGSDRPGQPQCCRTVRPPGRASKWQASKWRPVDHWRPADPGRRPWRVRPPPDSLRKGLTGSQVQPNRRAMASFPAFQHASRLTR